MVVSADPLESHISKQESWERLLRALKHASPRLNDCGDTISDIEEGRNAGMWTIGLTRTGNLIGLDAIRWAQLSAAEKDTHLKSAEEMMREAGADFVVQDIAECDRILTLIER